VVNLKNSKEERFKEALIMAGVIKRTDKLSLTKADYCEVKVFKNKKHIGFAVFNGDNYEFEPLKQKMIKSRQRHKRNTFKGKTLLKDVVTIKNKQR